MAQIWFINFGNTTSLEEEKLNIQTDFTQFKHWPYVIFCEGLRKFILGVTIGARIWRIMDSLKEDCLEATSDHLGLVWFILFYGISTFVGYLMPNPFWCK